AIALRDAALPEPIGGRACTRGLTRSPQSPAARRGLERGWRARTARRDQLAASLIHRAALFLNACVRHIFQIGALKLERLLEGARGRAPRRWSIAIAWSSISSKVITHPLPMRRAADSVGIGKATGAELYPREVTKESKKSCER